MKIAAKRHGGHGFRSRLTYVHAVLLVLAAGFVSAAEEPAAFHAARPVWPEGRRLEKNLLVGFRAVVDIDERVELELRVTASTVYRAWVNGLHVGYGPARGPHGFDRIDRWTLTDGLQKGKNVISIEVAGYNVNSYYTLDQPSFLQAEVLRGGNVLAATGVSGFEACIPGERVQKVQRYSFQRPFSEAYRIRADHDTWRNDPESKLESVPCAPDPRTLRYLPRRVPYPEFRLRRGEWKPIAAGALVPQDPGPLWKDRSLTQIGPKLGGYPEAELDVIPSIEMQKLASRPDERHDPAEARSADLALQASRYRILDFGLNNTGFVGVRLRASAPSRVALAFDEVLRGGDVDFKRLGCVNLVWIDVPAGTYHLESFEPYTFRYLKLMALEGACAFEDVYLREYSCSGVDEAEFEASDPRLTKLFEAGRETFRQNTLDTFMDCPSRERAGWLCDSFFTARVAPDLCGATSVEKAMMENFLLAERFEFLPDGMLPMCYPADHNDGVFIPNWALWFVVELEEYLARSGDRETVDRLRSRVLKLLEYLAGFENDDGLLEKLPSWVFVEWSDANKYVQDVNYPSNMLYAGALAVAGVLYNTGELTEKAAKIRETVRKQSFDGTFFVDNAVRKPDGSLEVTRNRTEVCQYFAFFFSVATTEMHAELWKTLRTQFGPKRRETNPYPEVGLANSFIGNMLRIELLSREERSQQILDESIDYLLYMADRTGTLWENVGDYASCNHGFASHIVHTLYRDVLGVRKVDRVGKRLVVRVPPLGLEFCRGKIPTPDGLIEIHWTRKNGRPQITKLEVPEGYTVDSPQSTVDR